MRWLGCVVTTSISLLLATGLNTPASAQSFLGTIRGTVADPQGQVVLVMPMLRLLHHNPTTRDARVESFQGRNFLADPRFDGW